MQLFLKLFEPYLQWFYHCFDRIVINGYLSFFMREINVAWFFRQICHKPKVTKEVLRERTAVYQNWVAAYARNHSCHFFGRPRASAKKTWCARLCGA